MKRLALNFDLDDDDDVLEPPPAPSDFFIALAWDLHNAVVGTSMGRRVRARLGTPGLADFIIKNVVQEVAKGTADLAERANRIRGGSRPRRSHLSHNRVSKNMTLLRRYKGLNPLIPFFFPHGTGHDCEFSVIYNIDGHWYGDADPRAAAFRNGTLAGLLRDMTAQDHRNALWKVKSRSSRNAADRRKYATSYHTGKLALIGMYEHYLSIVGSVQQPVTQPVRQQLLLSAPGSHQPRVHLQLDEWTDDTKH